MPLRSGVPCERRTSNETIQSHSRVVREASGCCSDNRKTTGALGVKQRCVSCRATTTRTECSARTRLSCLERLERPDRDREFDTSYYRVDADGRKTGLGPEQGVWPLLCAARATGSGGCLPRRISVRLASLTL